MFSNGDHIDGKGERSGGTEQIEPDRNEQVNMAVKCLEVAMAAKTRLVMTFGTPYHTGVSEDFEKAIAEKIEYRTDKPVKIGGHEWVEIEGVTFDLKHHNGSSGIPHGRHTAIARENLWATLWAEHDGGKKAAVIVRSHVHYFNYCGGVNWLGMTTPALQGLGSKYGTRQCSGIVDFGFIVFSVEKGTYTWEPHLLRLIGHESSIVRL